MQVKLLCGHRTRPVKSRVAKKLDWLWCPVCRATQPKAGRSDA